MIHHRVLTIAILLIAASTPGEEAMAQETIQIEVQVEARNLPVGVVQVMVECVLCREETCAADGIITPAFAYSVPMRAERGVRSALALDGEEGRPSAMFFQFSDAELPGVTQPLPGRSLSEATWYRCRMLWWLDGGTYVIPGPDVSGPAQTAPGTPLRTEVSGPIPR